MLYDIVLYRRTKIALYGPSGGTGIFFRQVLMLFVRSEAVYVGWVSRSTFMCENSSFLAVCNTSLETGPMCTLHHLLTHKEAST